MKTGIILTISCLLAINAIGQGKDYYAAARKAHYDARYDSAVSLFELAILQFQESNDLRSTIQASFEKGESLSNLGKCEEATDVIQTNLDLSISEFGESDSTSANGYYYLSRVYGGCSRQFDKAIALVQKSERIRTELFGESNEILAFNYTMLGYFYVSFAKYDSAVFYLEKAKNIRESLPEFDMLELSHTLNYLAKAHEGFGNISKALQLSQKSLEMREQVLKSNHPTISNSLNDLGNIYRSIGNFDRALTYFERALEIRKEKLGENHVNVGASYYTIGVLYGNMFNYQRSIQYINQGNLILEQAYGEKAPILHTYYAFLGGIHGQAGNFEQAEFYLKKAEKLATQHLDPNHLYLGIVYGFIGNYYSVTSEYEKQIDYLEKAKNIFENSLGGGTLREVDILTEMGEAYLDLGNWQMAEELLESALVTTQKLLGTKNPKAATLFLDLGILNFRQGKTRNAREYYLKCLDAVSIDSVSSDQEIDINSLIHKQLALNVMRRIAQSFYMEQTEISLMEAHRRYELALEILDAIKADSDLEVSGEQIGKDTRMIFTEGLRVSHELYEKTGDEKYKYEAFHMVEKSRSPILLSKIQDVEIMQTLGVTTELMQEDKDMGIELTFFKKKLRDAKAKGNDSLTNVYKKLVFDTQERVDEFKSGLKNDYPEYFKFKYEDPTLSIEEVQARIESYVKIIEYFYADSIVYAFSITNKESEFVKIGLGEQFLSSLSSYQRSLSDGILILDNAVLADSLYKTTAFQLYNTLVKPVLSETGERSQLVLIPDDVLSSINFNTLLTEEGIGGYADFKYLLTKYQISYAYSSTLNFRGKKNSNKFSFLGFAPSYNTELYQSVDSVEHPMTYELVRGGNLPLPGAIEEVKAISKQLGGEAWLNQQASETNFKKESGNYSILHLAMHSLLNADDPQFSELLFNAEYDTLNDGFLSVSEIYNLDLVAELVVLSACQSGSGTVQVGEGPISFGRAFSYAGCPSVVMSLWKVPDASTSDIMINFYENIKEGLRKDTALKKAQLDYLLNEGDPLKQHPYYWAGFIAMGNTRPVNSSNYNMVFWMLGVGFLVVVAVAVRRKFTST